MEGVWSEELQCRWLRWEVLDEQTLELYLPDFNCCDMTGCIKVGKSLMPQVRRIATYRGNLPDSRYDCLENEEWQASLPR